MESSAKKSRSACHYRTWLRRLSAGAAINGIFLGSALAQSGIDTRPANAACVAQERPVIETVALLEPAFPNLNFMTVPSVPDADHRNGPIAMAQIPGDNSRWFVAERAGKIHSVINDQTATDLNTVLDITGHFDGLRIYQQWGIQSFVFHPDFATNGWLFVAYNDNDGNTENIHTSYLSRFTSTDGGLSFDPTTEEVILTVDQETDFHHFGHVAFGPDGYLYLSSGASPGPTGQDKFSLRGTLIRIDVDSGLPYTIPADNPFVNGGGLPEIYAWGLRNPWRFSFDRATGELWLGDVGAHTYEEVNIIENGGNYGWKQMEGAHCFNDAICNTGGKKLPLLEYSHDVGAAIIGGFVYRGSEIPELQGIYLFGDRVSGGLLWGVFYDELGEPFMAPVVDFADIVSGFAEDQNGEIYAYNVAQQNNPQQAQVRRLVSTGRPARSNGFPALLSETGCVDPDNATLPATSLIPYELNSALWSDGADKRRWLAIPDGTTIGLTGDGDFDFPVGTVLVKEFSFNGTPVETRLLMRHDDGLWGGYSYEWNEDLSDAVLLPAGKTKVVDGGTTWTYPSRAQCMQCHTQAANFSLGPEIAQLNKDYTYPGSGVTANQLETLEHIGMFAAALPAATNDLPALVQKDDSTVPVERRARGYLHANCSGCHRPGGPPQSNLNFRFDVSVDALNACDTNPVHGNLGVSGAKLLKPGDPAKSVMSLRMNALDVHRMPPLGTDIIDTVGAQAVADWISASDVCTVYPDTDSDGTPDNIDNCQAVANADQSDIDGDGFGDYCDTCAAVANPLQRDTDADGHGNLCDADLDQTCAVNFADLAIMKSLFFTADPGADLDGDGTVNFGDLGIMKSGFFQPPGAGTNGALCN